MPTLTPTLIQGSDKANQIDEKVMGVVDAIYGFLTATGTPSNAAVNITNALFDYYTDGEDKQHFSNIRLIGPGDDNGVRIHDCDDPAGGEIRIRVDGDGELSPGDGDDIPTVHVEVRISDGDIDDPNDEDYAPLVSINANGLYLHQQILDITQATPGDLTGDYELINRLDFIGTEITRVEELIATSGIQIDGDSGIKTTTGTTPEGDPKVTIELDTTDTPAGDGEVFVSYGTGYRWEPQTDTIYAEPAQVGAGFSDTFTLSGEPEDDAFNITPDTVGSSIIPLGGTAWSATTGVAITVPYTGYYIVSAECSGRTADSNTFKLTLTCSSNSPTPQESHVTAYAIGSTKYFSMSVSDFAHISAGNFVKLEITPLDGDGYVSSLSSRVSLAKIN